MSLALGLVVPTGLSFELFVDDVEASVRFHMATLGLAPPDNGPSIAMCP